MNEIITKQNLPKQIDKLAAQRYLYSRSKNIFYLRIFLSLVFAIAVPLLINILGNILYYAALTMIFYLVIDIFVLEQLENSYKEDAAKIQENFDMETFGMSWNNVIAGDKIDEEKICKYANLYTNKNTIDNLLNWYSQEVSKLGLIPAIAVCQRTNIFWDISLRKKIFWSIIIFLIIVAFTIFIFSKNPILLMCTVIPFYKVMADYGISQSRTIKTIEGLKNKIEKFLEELSNHKMDQITFLKNIQDEIFRHRKSAAFVPDMLYKLNRNNQEREMNYGALYYVERLLEQRAVNSNTK